MSVVVSMSTVCKALVVFEVSLHQFMCCSDDEGEDENYYHCFHIKKYTGFQDNRISLLLEFPNPHTHTLSAHSRFEKWSFFIALSKFRHLLVERQTHILQKPETDRYSAVSCSALSTFPLIETAFAGIQYHRLYHSSKCQRHSYH